MRDVATLVVAVVADARSCRHRVFNAGSGRAVTAREAVGLLADAAGFTGGSARPAYRAAALGGGRLDPGRHRPGRRSWAGTGARPETSIKDIWAAGEAR